MNEQFNRVQPTWTPNKMLDMPRDLSASDAVEFFRRTLYLQGFITERESRYIKRRRADWLKTFHHSVRSRAKTRSVLPPEQEV